MDIKKNDFEINPPTTPPMAVSILSDALFPERKKKSEQEMDIENENGIIGEEDKQKEDPLAAQVWRLYTKAKDTLPNGARLENLTWRMMAMTLNKKKAAAATATTGQNESLMTDTASSITNEKINNSDDDHDMDMFIDTSAPIVDHSSLITTTTVNNILDHPVSSAAQSPNLSSSPSSSCSSSTSNNGKLSVSLKYKYK
ncbi:hypothetical protein BJ944DRAFT_24147 [Cunninghamella echinulata]|nr:hypothetical protein BJ944DRAFT_24147 [Cunninghamella echinulata]